MYTPNMFEENIRKLSFGEGHSFTDFMYEIVEKHFLVLKAMAEGFIKSPQQKPQKFNEPPGLCHVFSD